MGLKLLLLMTITAKVYCTICSEEELTGVPFVTCDGGGVAAFLHDLPSYATDVEACHSLIYYYLCHCDPSGATSKMQNVTTTAKGDIKIVDGYCHLETRDGIYQVATSSMANPPTGTIIFSYWD